MSDEPYILPKLRVYVAGPMSGYPQFNFPMFDWCSYKLRRDGFVVFSPAELDEPEERRIALQSSDGDHQKIPGKTWGDYLARDVKIVGDEVDAVVVIPGWSKSKGARLETFVAFITGKPVYRFNFMPNGPMRRLPLWRLSAAWLLAR